MPNEPRPIPSSGLISPVSETIRGTLTAHSGYNGDANNRDYGKVDVGRQRVRSTNRERWHERASRRHMRPRRLATSPAVDTADTTHTTL